MNTFDLYAPGSSLMTSLRSVRVRGAFGQRLNGKKITRTHEYMFTCDMSVKGWGSTPTSPKKEKVFFFLSSKQHALTGITDNKTQVIFYLGSIMSR